MGAVKRLWGVYENRVVVSLITQARLLNLGNDFKAGGSKEHDILLRACCVVSQTHLKERVQKFITGTPRWKHFEIHRCRFGP